MRSSRHKDELAEPSRIEEASRIKPNNADCKAGFRKLWAEAIFLTVPMGMPWFFFDAHDSQIFLKELIIDNISHFFFANNLRPL